MRYYVSLINRARRARQNAEVDTQKLRRKLLVQLEEMFDLAKKYSETAKTAKQKQLFMRVTAYVAQVMNSLTKAFDEATVTKDLEELERMIGEAMAKEKDKGTQGKTGATPRG